MKKEKSCGAVVFTKKNNKTLFLLIQHKKGDHWDFPKGHVEKGETERQTALREINEETGLEVTLLEGFRSVIKYSPAKNIEKTVVFFLAHSTSRKVTIQAEEIKAHEWLPYEKAMESLTFEKARVRLKKAQAFLLKAH